VPDAVLDVLANSSIRDIHVVVRRSPADAKFTTKELRELGELAGVQVVVHPDDLREVADPERLGAAPLATRRNLELMSRVLREGAPAVGEYVVGWLARGPSGVVGTGKVDAPQVAAHIRDDSAALVGRPVGSVDPQTLFSRADGRGVTWSQWELIDAVERSLGRQRGAPRIKLDTWQQLVRAATSGS
jgi:hypothetical protein